MNFETLDSKTPADIEVERLFNLSSDERASELSRYIQNAFIDLPDYSLCKENMIKDPETVKDSIFKIINLFWTDRLAQASQVKKTLNHLKSLSPDFIISARDKTQLTASVSTLFEFSASLHDLVSDIFQSKLFDIARRIKYKEDEFERYNESLKEVPESLLLKDMQTNLVKLYEEKERIISLEKVAKIIIDDWYQENNVK
jgi:hypothetical protein